MAICSLLHEMFNPRTLFCFVFKKKDKNSQRYSLNNQDKTKTVLFFCFALAIYLNESWDIRENLKNQNSVIRQEVGNPIPHQSRINCDIFLNL